MAAGRWSFGSHRTGLGSFPIGFDVEALSGVAGRLGCVGQRPELPRFWQFGWPVPAVVGAEGGDIEGHPRA